MSFAFDISYKLTGNINDDEELEMRIFNITKSYISCTWCAADSNGTTKNLGFEIPKCEIVSLHDIIKKVKSTPNIYIDFIYSHEDEIEIYRSPSFLKNCSDAYCLEYNQIIGGMTNPTFIELNRMCSETR